jgi:hypothetical protein
VTTPLADSMARVQRLAFVVGGAGSALMGLGLAMDSERFFQAYLMGYLYWLAPALGSLAIVMLHQMTGGAWGFAVRRLLEAGARTLPFMALAFVPIALGIHDLYEWSHPSVVSVDPILLHKQRYLNQTWFLIRAAAYFVLWIALAITVVRLSERYDRKLSLKALRRLKTVAGFGVALYVLSMTFASFDWGMSLEPHWFSTIYGVQFIVGQGLATLCLAIVVASRIARHEPFSRWLDAPKFHDLGNLMMAFVLLWAYVSFSQFLIIWSADLPEENPWYLKRTGHQWQAMALLLVVCHFAAPFFILLMRAAKRNASRLALIAIALLAMRSVDIYWVLAPAFREGEFQPHWLDLVAPIAMGGLWIGLFVKNLRGRPLVSLQDAKLQGSLEGVL